MFSITCYEFLLSYISNVILYVCEGKGYWVHTELLTRLVLSVYANYSVSCLISNEISGQEYTYIHLCNYNFEIYEWLLFFGYFESPPPQKYIPSYIVTAFL